MAQQNYDYKWGYMSYDDSKTPSVYHVYDTLRANQQSNEQPVVHISVESSKTISTRFWIIAGIIIAVLLVTATVAVTLLVVNGGDNDIPGKWSGWSEWSDCSATCDEGFTYRERLCPAGECRGMEAESTYCFEMVCPAEYGTWSTWGAWSSCGQTCGVSTQQRSRQCTKQDDQMDCEGPALQDRECNDGDCPDCDKPCNGIWDDNCQRCTCQGNSGTGRVITEQGEPISNVKISPSDMPFYTLATTGTNGVYTVSDLCLGSEIIFHRDGFMRFFTTVQSTMTDITLVAIETLSMTKELKGGARLTGGCIQLTCESRGRPSPDYVEWMQNGRSVMTGSNILRIDNVKKEDSGTYQCRANNDYSSIYSRRVQVRIEESATNFCNPTPMPKYIDLPHGCLYGDEARVNVGQCMATACSFGEEKCEEETKSRCGAVEYIEETLTCGQQALPISIAEKCGCVPFEDKHSYAVRGVVLTADDGSPVYLANITVNGVFAGTTDLYGEFYFTGELDTPRIIITFVPTIGDFAVYSTTLNLEDDDENEIRYMTIRIQRRLPQINKNANSDIHLSLGSSQYSTGFASIVIPANSLQTSDGNTYQGEAAVNIELVDTRDIDTVQLAPGDFSAIDEEGSELMLQSTGMFRLDIEDLEGNDLVLSGNVTISYQQEELNNDIISPTKLWSLDPNNGRWQMLADFQRVDAEAVSNLRYKRQLYRGNFSAELESIRINQQWINFDQVSQESCYSKIRVYETNEFKLEEEHNNARVSVISGTSSIGYTRSSLRAYSDSYDNGFCIIHPCDTDKMPGTRDYHGYIIGTHGNEVLHPSKDEPGFPPELDYSTSDDAMKATFNLEHSTPYGPFYDYDGSAWNGNSYSCSQAQNDDMHFKFYKYDAGDCKLNGTNRYNGGELDWYMWKPPGNGYMYVKIATEWTDESAIRSISYVGQNDDYSIPLRNGDWYGIREDCTENQAVCLELKTSGPVTDGNSVNYNVLSAFNITLEKADFKFDVEVRDMWNFVSRFNKTINVYDDHISVTLFKENEERYGRSFGIYYHGNQTIARNACRQGTAGAGVQTPEMSSEEWAFKLKRRT